MSCTCQHTNSTEQAFVCLCDRFEHPPALNIGAGSSELPRQIAGFPEFRRAMLYSLRNRAPLAFWRASSPNDLGLMILEMWAYICDVLSFYDKAIAQESYLRTAKREPSLRRLVALLGYRPRPAVAASVQLAALADGRLPFTLPAGTAFRSGSFNGNPPQVFELDEDSVIHPLTNSWNIRPPHPGVILQDNPIELLIQVRANIEPDTFLLLIDQADPSQTQPLKVRQAGPYQGKDGKRYFKIEFTKSTQLKAGTPLHRLRLMKPTRIAALWTLAGQVAFSSNQVWLDNIYRDLRPEDHVLIQKGKEESRWFLAKVIEDTLQTIDSTQTRLLTTKITLDVDLNENSRKSSNLDPWVDNNKGALRVHYGLIEAGHLVDEAKTSLAPADPMALEGPVELPDLEYLPTRFFLSDLNSRGIAITGRLGSEGKVLTSEDVWSPDLKLPVEVFGNPIQASRGETVRNERLGSGNAAIANQTFRLKKGPLTYLFAPTANNDQGIKSTLRVYVNGVRWKEVSSFYGRSPEEEIYIVRQNEDGDSLVTCGDGIRGRRLPTGIDNVIAYYRYGAGQASPPTGSISQIETPIPGLGSIRNPIPAAGGADAESTKELKTHAPHSALLLGRVVSLADMEAVALSMPGVRAVQTAWKWHGVHQRAVAHIWYIGESEIGSKVTKRLCKLTDPSMIFHVTQAMPVAKDLTLNIKIDPRYHGQEVLATIRQKLTNQENGLLAPEHIGIGKPLFRSKIFEAVIAVEGVNGIRAISWENEHFEQSAKVPEAGHYFHFEEGSLRLNESE